MLVTTAVAPVRSTRVRRMTWEHYGCDISEELIVNITDAMVEHGYKDAGYEYVNIDDCWQAPQRDSNGKIMADNASFPHGIKWLADYVHSQTLKFGICAPLRRLVPAISPLCRAGVHQDLALLCSDTDYGTATCEGRPGTPLKYQEIDAQTVSAPIYSRDSSAGCTKRTSEQ
jgi:hypothetical protein